MNSAATPTQRPEQTAVEIRDLAPPDLPAINHLITSAIATWDLAPRVRRLAEPSYRYDEHDCQQLKLLGAYLHGRLVGIAATQTDCMEIAAGNGSALLLHGLFVHPDVHREGIGTALVDAAKAMAIDGSCPALFVRAERDAVPFFERCGFTKLPIIDEQRDYPHRLVVRLGTPDLASRT